jgi:hypothetical protein
VWTDGTPGSIEIFYKRSTDGGIKWSKPARLTWKKHSPKYLSIASDKGNGVHLVWLEYVNFAYEVFYKCSSDGGITWSGPKRLTWNYIYDYDPQIPTNAGNGIHIVWARYDYYKFGDGTTDILYKSTSDYGATWSTTKILTRIQRRLYEGEIPYWRYYDCQSIATDFEDGVHVVWNEDLNSDIFYKFSSDFGDTWSENTELTWTSYGANNPFIAADKEGGIHVVWINKGIYYKNRK